MNFLKTQVVFVLISEGNLALGKPARQSSLHYPYSVASTAVDGDRNPSMGAGSCTHTQSDTGAWWEVDLQDVYPVKYVQITNRYGKCLWMIEWLEFTFRSTC